MSASSHPSRDRIEHEASVWTARLETSALSPVEQKELADWLAMDSEHRFILSRYRAMCAELAGQVPALMDAAEVDAVVARATRVRRRRRFVAPLLAVAAAIAVVATGLGMLPEKVATKSSERRTLALSDGSRLELNADTSLEVSLRRGERRVKFAHGEALFQVTRDAARPFFVATPHGVVRVTGTQFNVRATATGDVEVTVLEGSVQVSGARDAAHPVMLIPGQSATLGVESVSVRQLAREETQDMVAWRIGQAAFQGVPLAEALARFAPYHAGKLTVSAEASAFNVGGRYSLDDLDGFLAAIEQALPVAVLRSAEGTVRVIARRPQPSTPAQLTTQVR